MDNITLTAFERRAGVTIDDKIREHEALAQINAAADIIGSHYPKRKKEVPKRRNTYKFMQYTIEAMHSNN